MKAFFPPIAILAAVAIPLLAAGNEQGASEFNALGVQHYEARDWPQAIADFEQAYELAPDHATVRRNLCNGYQAYANELAAAHKLPAAIEQLEFAIGVDPENPQPLLQLGAFYIQEGHISLAIFRLEEAIEIAPSNVDAHFLLGEAYHKDDDVSSALDQWEWVYEVTPGREGLAERIEASLREEKVEFNFEGRSSRNFNVIYNPDTSWTDVRNVLQILEMAHRRIGRTLGNAYPPTPIQVALYSAEGFTETTQAGEHVGALYDGTKIRVPVLGKDGKVLGSEELRRRLYHEYVHVVTRHIAKNKVPWWLNEGLAEILSRDMTDDVRKVLRWARQQKILFSLQELEESQLERLDPDSLKMAYHQSHATLAFLKERYGVKRITAFLRELGEGADPETALRRVFRMTYNTLELATASYIGTG